MALPWSTRRDAYRHRRGGLVVLAWLALQAVLTPSAAADAGALPVLHVTTVTLRAGAAPQPDLVCPRIGVPVHKPPPATAEPVLEIPDPEEVRAALESAAAAPEAPAPASSHLELVPPPSERPFRVAVWGDSHMAAGYFTEELARILAPAGGVTAVRYAHAALAQPGVRGLVRKVCLTPMWTREAAYARRDAAAAPGPGLVSLVAKRAGESITVDLRDGSGMPVHRVLRLLYTPTEQTTTIALGVDDQAEQLISLPPGEGPAALELGADAPMSILRLRLEDGSLRFQGLRFDESAVTAALQLDVFGSPGATAAGWAHADLGQLGAWFGDEHYDLVLMAFGTNEGNNPKFNGPAYRQTLLQAVGNLRRLFPQARCLLVAPGDRGIKVARAGKPRKSARPVKGTRGKPVPARRTAAVRGDLLKFSRVHELIAGVQDEVAQQFGCGAWSMQSAMGGRGTAYQWVRLSPALMAGDLTHFTAAGYRELARRLAADVGWSAR